MRIIRKGCTRIVFLIGNYAFKIPNFTVCHMHFLNGCQANWKERDYCLTFQSLEEFRERVVPTLFCSWFGLLSIQRRVTELERDLTEHEVIYFKEQTVDIKRQNFGWFNGKLVCVDYA